MKKSDVQQNIRLAGLVRRYHTWPVLHQQTVAEHSWQVMRLYDRIFGCPPAHVFQHILHHDVGEVRTGDIPYPLKSQNETLKKEMDRLETSALADMGIDLPTLTDEEHIRFKFCDLLDCAEQGQYEARLGNRYMGIVADQRNGLEALLRKLSDADRVLARTYCIENGIQLYGEG